MQATHFHLLLNHVPILGVGFGFLILIIGIIRSSNTLRSTALWVFFGCGIAAVLAYLSGGAAEEIVEGLPWISDTYLEPHEEWAGIALWITIVLGLLSVAALLFPKQKFLAGKLMNYLLILVSLAAFATMVYTGLTGGQIRHDEIRGDAVTQTPLHFEQPGYEEEEDD